jgi:hypothetical protein
MSRIPLFRTLCVVGEPLAVLFGVHRRGSQMRRSLTVGRTPRLVGAIVTSVVAIMSVAILPATVAGAATVGVSSCADSGPGTLRAAVATAAPGDTITFLVACPPATPITVASPIDITTSLTIAGLGPNELAVSGGTVTQIFTVSAGVTVTISGITIENGSADAGCTVGCSSSGGGIDNSGTLTVSNSVLSGNEANAGCDANCGASGGGIENESGGTLTVTDSTLVGNSANGDCGDGCGGTGGGIENESGGTLTVTDSTLSDNEATSGCGEFCVGAGGGLDNAGTATVTASTVSGNQADNSCTNNCGPNGGGIDNESTGTLMVQNSTVADNQANSGCVQYCGAAGGGVYDDGSLTIDNSTLSGNSVSGGCSNNCGNAGADFYEAQSGGTLPTVAATIMANGSGASDCGFAPSAFIVDQGYNLDDDGSCFVGATDFPATPAGLDPAGLENNGGPTETIALEPGSAAIDKVIAALCPATDQRGFPRHAPCDIGAYDTDGGPGGQGIGSAVDTVIEVETNPSYAGDPVDVSSSQLQSSCGGTITFETLQNGGVGNVTTATNHISVILDDDGNVSLVVEGADCAPGSDVVEADMTVAPYLTALTTLVVNPPSATAPGVSGSPADEVETGDSPASGESDVYTVFYVETSPVYAEQTVEISAPELESRCGLGWRWEPGNGGPEIDGPATGHGTASTTLDDDGNAVFVFEGASCAAGPSTVIADVEAGVHATYTTTYTVGAPQVTAPGGPGVPTVDIHGKKAPKHHGRHHRQPVATTPPPTAPTMTVTANPNPLVETGS